jgi:hypothetical protein
MAISTYAELQTAVSNWLDRSDLTSRIPEFITLAEGRIGRKLRIREMETESDVSLVAGTRTAAVPTGFREVRRVRLDTTPVRELQYISPQDYWARYMSTNTDKPQVFTVEGTNMVFGPIPDAAYTAKVLHYKAFDALSTGTNAVFLANPDLYLYGSLLAAEPFLKNDKRVGMWKGMFDEAMMELEMQNSRHPGQMVMRNDYNPG